MFGVVGGGLGAYKMSKRVKGLSEWRIRKETTATSKESSAATKGLHATVCVSGWLAEECDFQKPWGVQPNDPPESVLDSLQRYLCITSGIGEKIPDAKELLAEHKDQEDKLWIELSEIHGGKTPDTLLPLDRSDAPPVLSEQTQDDILRVLLHQVLPEQAAQRMKQIWETNSMLVQMEFKNQEVLSRQTSFGTAQQEEIESNINMSKQSSFALASVEDEESVDEEDMEQIRQLKEQALQIEASHSVSPGKEQATNVESVVQSVLEAPLDTRGAATTDQSLSEPSVADTTEAEIAEEGSPETSTTVSARAGAANDSPSEPSLSTPSEAGKAKESYPSGTIDTKTIEPQTTIEVTDIKVDEKRSSEEQEPATNVDETIRPSSTFGSDDIQSLGSNGGVPTSESMDLSETRMLALEKAVEATEVVASDGMTTDHLQVIWDWEATFGGEMYTVTWETDFLLKLCRVATTLFLELSDVVGKQILLNALVGAAVAVPSALHTFSGVIDDPYQIISLRSKKAGAELAYCLLQSDEHRPISLVGYSFGARLIFDCLLELAKHQLIWQERRDAENGEVTDTSKRKNARNADSIDYVREPASIIEDVVLIGMPRTIDSVEWVRCREIVGGRLVNCFNRKDWIVSYMINVRCGGGVRKTCGTHAVQTIQGVENYEVSDFAPTHDRYLVAVPQILHKVGYGQPRSAERLNETEVKK